MNTFRCFVLYQAYSRIVFERIGVCFSRLSGVPGIEGLMFYPGDVA
ncbi:MAG: hypothetical protein LBV74_21670 [Tannerella sp.]|jgi:hypothetical protein|nr:hypothetical protein [Tannerella sp.]